MLAKQSFMRNSLAAVVAAATLLGTSAGLVGAVATRAVAAPSCNQTVDAAAVHSVTTTIQGGIDAASPGDTICVWPGLYNQDQANGRSTDTGGSGPNDFNIFVGKSVTIEGLDSSGNAITTRRRARRRPTRRSSRPIAPTSPISARRTSSCRPTMSR